MRDLFKTLIVGAVILFAPMVSAETYKLLILPDNVVTQNAAIDSYIYDSASEFFADEIAALLNTTDNIETKTISEVRDELKKNPTAVLAAKELTNRFKTAYNVDYNSAKKLASQTNNRYVLLLTSTIDAENYILRRTWWDFFNIAGASVIDPAYKINTYAVLIDTKNNQKLWSDTYYKTISVVENRIITRGPSPQTEQLGKIKDYSRYVCPQIAHYVQANILPENVLASESNIIDYDMGNIDNVFTKKYRHIGNEAGKAFHKQKTRHNEAKARRAERKAEKNAEKERQRAELEVQAEKVNEKTVETSSAINNINTTVKSTPDNVKNAVYEPVKIDNELFFDDINIRKSRKNNLFGEYDYQKPYLRDYSK